MAYRDDEIGQLLNKVNSFEKRLAEFEALYQKEGVKYRKSIIVTFFGRLRDLTKSLFNWVRYRVFQSPIFWIPTGTIGLAAGLWVLVSFLNEQDTRSAEAARSIETEQCTSFCVNHGFYYYEGNKQGNLCFCSTEESETTVFIVDVETAENWSIRASQE